MSVSKSKEENTAQGVVDSIVSTVRSAQKAGLQQELDAISGANKNGLSKVQNSLIALLVSKTDDLNDDNDLGGEYFGAW